MLARHMLHMAAFYRCVRVQCVCYGEEVECATGLMSNSRERRGSKQWGKRNLIRARLPLVLPDEQK